MVTYENGEKANDIKSYRFCPTVAKMDPQAEATHGISMEQLRGEPTFESKAVEIRDTLAQANSLMGYNLRFDLKMLQAEYCTAGVEPLALAGVAIIDPFFIWDAQRRKCKGERRKLVNAHQVFLGEPMENAHNAAADIIATAHVYNAMVEDFHLAGLDGAAIDRMYRGNKIDFEGKFVRNPQGEVVFNFGQHKGMAVVDPSFKSYLDWMVSRGDFFPDARRIAELARKFSTDKDTFNATIGDSHRQHVLA
ncbi:EXOIII [Seminavis robusta]|uniref:EXOIII n=1 Tax=Seminavis robusta TaxID=568900 RepID=A0A9N8HJL1_9STRA|nr:EXOIII [Seminavis robusta]|eukprot:Sro669_g184580.1 EXOIII (250) ;mRNA; f:42099-42848